MATDAREVITPTVANKFGQIVVVRGQLFQVAGSPQVKWPEVRLFLSISEVEGRKLATPLRIECCGFDHDTGDGLSRVVQDKSIGERTMIGYETVYFTGTPANMPPGRAISDRGWQERHMFVVVSLE